MADGSYGLSVPLANALYSAVSLANGRFRVWIGIPDNRWDSKAWNHQSSQPSSFSFFGIPIPIPGPIPIPRPIFVP
jgi:hypothetical protein